MGRRALEVDKIVMDLILTDDTLLKKKLAKKILDMAYKKGIYPSSIHEFYMARGRGEFEGFTVPAMNLRSMTYDLARAVFRTAKKNNAGAFIFEIAKSEMGYTSQAPVEYTAVILAAAIKEGYQGPVFIQADHCQVNAKKFQETPEKELEALQNMIADSISEGFYNIDIDSSTLVDLSKKDIKQQQKNNYEVCAKLTQLIRRIEPKGITVSVGGEIGEVGHQNSTPEDLRAFMAGYKERLRKGLIGISKISVQTGTSHGGVVKADGSIAEVKLDFGTLNTLSGIAQKEFALGGAVQHGASTLPEEMFHKFPENNTLEVHLATGFQNMMFDSKHFPEDLKKRIYEWLKVNASSERKEGESDEQFFYKARKKALGPFKKDIMGLAQETRDKIAQEIEAKFDFLFKQLGAVNNRQLTDKYISLKRVITRKRQEAPVVHDGEGAD
ncbi:MAG: class II fructose-bisphosphate aldolase [Candidatus Omnitrophica bacterium]|jgi:fructose/tagatose bisphosphate aldolase|nr:class II fructose-bisphosphate aldolase [Candidatus Omnitrophota bacterium]